MKHVRSYSLHVAVGSDSSKDAQKVVDLLLGLSKLVQDNLDHHAYVSPHRGFNLVSGYEIEAPSQHSAAGWQTVTGERDMAAHPSEDVYEQRRSHVKMTSEGIDQMLQIWRETNVKSDQVRISDVAHTRTAFLLSALADVVDRIEGLEQLVTMLQGEDV